MAQAFGPMNNLKNMLSVLKEISFDEIREEALRAPRVLVYGPTAHDARWFADTLFGESPAQPVAARDLGGPVDDLGQYDMVIVYDPEGEAEPLGLNARLRSLGMTPPIFRHGGVGAHEQARIDALRLEIAKRSGDRTPAIGRAFPAMRAAAAKVTIDETSIANAQFALVSNIPAVLPIFGGLAAAGADFIVLTKNQVMMIYKLAAIYGRDLGDQVRILQEIAPVVGFGFAWRSAARGATSMLPFAAGTLPKVGIAYAGTMVAGRGAEFYYRTERKPTKAQFEQYARQAVDTVATVAQSISVKGKGKPKSGPARDELDD